MKKTELKHDWLFSLNGNAPEKVSLPHDYSMSIGRSAAGTSGKDGGWYSGGYGQYSLQLPQIREEICELWFDGVQGITEVWINDNRVAIHPNGYTPFLVDIKPYLCAKKNELTVKVNSSAMPS